MILFGSSGVDRVGRPGSGHQLEPACGGAGLPPSRATRAASARRRAERRHARLTDYRGPHEGSSILGGLAGWLAVEVGFELVQGGVRGWPQVTYMTVFSQVRGHMAFGGCPRLTRALRWFPGFL